MNPGNIIHTAWLARPKDDDKGWNHAPGQSWRTTIMPYSTCSLFFFLLLWRRGGEFIPISKEEESSLHAAAAMIPLVRRCRLIFPWTVTVPLQLLSPACWSFSGIQILRLTTDGAVWGGETKPREARATRVNSRQRPPAASAPLARAVATAAHGTHGRPVSAPVSFSRREPERMQYIYAVCPRGRMVMVKKDA